MLDNRTVVIPGDVISEDPAMAGSGTYVDNDIVHAAIYGLVNVGKSRVSIIPHKGKYFPAIDDKVIGIVTGVQRQRWIIDINSPYMGSLHISQYPKRINLNEMDKYLTVGDAILARITDVDAMYNIELTMNDKGLKVLQTGRIVSICPTKMSRVIGRAGSMIRTIKNETGCGMFVGQNGMIWVNGSEESIDLAAGTIKHIEENAHTSGLTDKVVTFLKAAKGIDEDEAETTSEEIDEFGDLSESSESEYKEIIEDSSQDAAEDEEFTEGSEDIGAIDYLENTEDVGEIGDVEQIIDIEETEDADTEESDVKETNVETTSSQDEENEANI